ncbi:MAG: hypothetical protein RIG61_05905 [Deltaproteobacteria bacterium]
MKADAPFVRNLDAVYHVEIFLVCAVAAILSIRLFLHMTGYPQIGNSTLHIAHMLWGGLLMLVAIVMLFSFIGERIELWAAILGGAGFGTFIDEVGKFVTSDNNYFFEPSVSIMYIVFILIVLSIHMIRSGWTFTEKEFLVNALRGLEEIALRDLDEDEKNKVMRYLEKSEPGNPLTKALTDIVTSSALVPAPEPGLYTRVKKAFRGYYERIAGYRYFKTAIVIFFLLQLIITLSYVAIFTVFIGLGPDKFLNIKIFETVADRLTGLTFIGKAQIFSSALSGLFVFLGVYYIRKSRLTAYRMFERSVLVSILLTYVFIFYREQFAALAGLAFNMFILIGLRIMIKREEQRS